MILMVGILIFVGLSGKPKPSETKQPGLSPAPQIKEGEEGLGGEIYEKVQNPGEKLPQVNPFEAQTNPFQEAKTNPFEGGYKNPFK